MMYNLGRLKSKTSALRGREACTRRMKNRYEKLINEVVVVALFWIDFSKEYDLQIHTIHTQRCTASQDAGAADEP